MWTSKLGFTDTWQILAMQLDESILPWDREGERSNILDGLEELQVEDASTQL